jgi:hypothetical protein
VLGPELKVAETLELSFTVVWRVLPIYPSAALIRLTSELPAPRIIFFHSSVGKEAKTAKASWTELLAP